MPTSHVGDFRQALDAARGRWMALLTGERRSARFGQVNLPAVISRVYVAWCLAETGGLRRGRCPGRRGAAACRGGRAALQYCCCAYRGLVSLARRQGDSAQATPAARTGLWASVRAPTSRCSPPSRLILGCGVCPRRARCRGAAAAGPDAGARGHREPHALPGTRARRAERGHICSSVASRRRARLPDASSTSPAPTQDAATRRMRYRLLGDVASTARAPRHRAGRSPLPPGPRPGRGTRHAPAPGPLPPRPRHAVCQTGQREQARAELSTAIELYRAMDMTFWLPQAEAALAQREG